MVDTIYVEKEIESHFRTQKIIRRFPNAQVIGCDRYTEIFNRKGQDFSLQKTHPSLILAKKHKSFLLSTPLGYGVGGEENYYFSHMLNCVYDCRYCFLQGMYHSANYVVFVNYEDFTNEITLQSSLPELKQRWYFSGYDCDSLVFEPVTGFMTHCLDVFEKIPQSFLEIRTKSTQVKCLLNRSSLPNVVVAFSFTPDDFSRRFENGVPNVEKRITSMLQLQEKGWKVGLRFDPMMSYDGYKEGYLQLFEKIFTQLNHSLIHSVSMGGFRMPKAFYKKIKKHYPNEPLYNLAMEDVNGSRSLPQTDEQQVLDFCKVQLSKWMIEDKLYLCEL